MHDTTVIPQAVEPTHSPAHSVTVDEREVVSTHVLVEQEKVDMLRELSKRTRVAQSEYLREAVDDLLNKYHKLPEEP
jgi:hypothetical protein